MEIDSPLDRVRYVTLRYPQLQGLRLVPLALLFILSACWRAGLLPVPGGHTAYGPQAWFLGGLVLAVVLSYIAKAWYGSQVGAVGQRYVQNAAIPIVATCGIAGAATAVQLAFAWRVSLPTLAVGIVLFAVGARHFGLRGHYVLAAAVLALFSVLPLTNLPANALGVALDATIGTTLFITALGDHLLLVRTLRGPREAMA